MLLTEKLLRGMHVVSILSICWPDLSKKAMQAAYVPRISLN